VAYKTAFLSPNAFSGHLMLLVLVALVVGRRAAWAALAAVLLLWLGVAGRFLSGATVESARTFDPGYWPNWLRVLMIFTFVAGTCVTAVTFLVDKTIAAVHRAESLHDALTRESAQRIAMLEAQGKLEESLRQSRKLESLGTLAGGVAHDFNNLLMVISGHIELIESEELPAAVRESMAEIRAASQRASGLTRQLLAFGRRQVTSRTAINLDQLTHDTLRMLRRLLPASIQVEQQMRAPTATVQADTVELSQVIMNLCINARDAMPEGGRLTLTTEETDQCPRAGQPGQRWVCLRIQDNGTGMEAATVERAFEPFFTTKGAGAGTGLGLSTVHGIVAQLGGAAEISSTPGIGTTVSVWLPLCAAAEVAPSVTPSVAAPAHQTILVVDDDRGAREVNATLLRNAGYRVLTSENGEQAWELYQQRSQEIAAVVSDAIMPKMGGRELHRLIVARYGEVPFLVCSGYTDETFANDFFRHPKRAYLAKPYEAGALPRKLSELLSAAASLEQAGPGPEISDASATQRAAVVTEPAA
jgi:signal transduction histidine kinase/CheY-like chemotaxis protein